MKKTIQQLNALDKEKLRENQHLLDNVQYERWEAEHILLINEDDVPYGHNGLLCLTEDLVPVYHILTIIDLMHTAGINGDPQFRKWPILERYKDVWEGFAEMKEDGFYDNIRIVYDPEQEQQRQEYFRSQF